MGVGVCVYDVTQLGSELPEADRYSIFSLYPLTRLTALLTTVGANPVPTCPPQSPTSMFPHPQTPIRKHIPSATQGSNSTQKHTKYALRDTITCKPRLSRKADL